MRLTCTSCGAHGSIELFTADADARRFAALLTDLPAGLSGSVVRRYVALFRPHKRGLAWERACDLVSEIGAMVVSGGVDRNGQRFPASAALFSSSMQQMLDSPGSLVLPLKSHGYLITVIARSSGQEVAATEAATEQQRRDTSQLRQQSEESQEEFFARRRRELQGQVKNALGEKTT